LGKGEGREMEERGGARKKKVAQAKTYT